MTQLIRMNFKPTGQVVIKSEGYSGEDCRAATKPYEDALGLKQAEDLTQEYYQVREETQSS